MLAIEQREVPNALAGTQQGNRGFLSFVRRYDDAHAAFDDDVKRVAGVSLVEDGGPAPILVDVPFGGERPQLLLRQASQERNVLDQLLVCVIHRSIVARPQPYVK